MLIGYLISFIVLPVISKCSKNKLVRTALTFQDDRKSMSQALLSGWDNIIVGNNYNFSIWWKLFTKRWNAYNISSAKAVLWTQLSSTCATILSLVPVAATFVWIFATTTNDIAKLAALIATLPRQIQIIQHFEVLSTYTMHWYGTYARLKALMATISTAILPVNNKAELLERIKENEITLTINKIQTVFPPFDQFLEILTNLKNGRITIQGKNGTGKTTLINLLKKELKDKAYYLPTNSRLVFESTAEGTFSTGERIKAYLEELAKIHLGAGKKSQGTFSVNEILLLDEWDANLDTKNREVISVMLDKFAAQCCVIEISHRQREGVIYNHHNEIGEN
jgi:ABC-type bacteriocin/lantibiotic exporter with double-glycine peptidase domain